MAAQAASPRLAAMEEEEEVGSTPASAPTPGAPASTQPATAARGLFTGQAPEAAAVPDVASATAEETDGDDAPYESFEGGQGAAGEVDASAAAAASGADMWRHDDKGWGDPEVDVVQPAESQGSAPARVFSEAAAAATKHAAAEDAAGGDAAAFDTAGGDPAADAAEGRPGTPSRGAEAEGGAAADAADGWVADEGGWDDVDGESASGDEAAGVRGAGDAALPSPAAQLLAAHEAAPPADDQVAACLAASGPGRV